MRLIIENTAAEASRWAAEHVAERINAKAAVSSKPFVLGLPTGSTPLGMYAELIKLNKAGKVSFANVITFNMDEYVAFRMSIPRATTRSCGTTSSRTSTSSAKMSIS